MALVHGSGFGYLMRKERPLPGAAVQAVRAEAPGVLALDIEVSTDLTRAYYREVQDALD